MMGFCGASVRVRELLPFICTEERHAYKLVEGSRVLRPFKDEPDPNWGPRANLELDFT